MATYDDAHLCIEPEMLRVYVEGQEAKVTLTEWRMLLALLKIYPESLNAHEMQIVLFGSNSYLWKYNAMTTYISRLRRKIGKEYIFHTGAGYQFYSMEAK